MVRFPNRTEYENLIYQTHVKFRLIEKVDRLRAFIRYIRIFLVILKILFQTNVPLLWSCRFDKGSYPVNPDNPVTPGSDNPVFYIPSIHLELPF